MQTNHFTRLEGLVVQASNLQEWRKRLNEETYHKVQLEALRRNELLKSTDTGYNVWRGSSITEFICNLH